MYYSSIRYHIYEELHHISSYIDKPVLFYYNLSSININPELYVR